MAGRQKTKRKGLDRGVRRYLAAILFIAMAMFIIGISTYLTTVIPSYSIPVGYIVTNNNPQYTVVVSLTSYVGGYYAGDQLINLDKYYTSPDSSSGKVWVLVFKFNETPGGYFNLKNLEVASDNVIQAKLGYIDHNDSHLIFWATIPSGVIFNQVGVERSYTMTGGNADITIFEISNTTDPGMLIDHVYGGVSFVTQKPVYVDSMVFLNVLSFSVGIVLMVVALVKLGIKI